MNDVILKTDTITGGYVPNVDILHGISLEVKQGASVGILGLNGSGKSSLGKALVNMLPYRSGTLIYEGNDITNLSAEAISRAGIRMMFQGGQVFQSLSIWDNMRLVTGGSFEEQMERLRPLIPILDAAKKQLMGTMADRLSGGQRHQLALAMTLATLPKIVVLDEPSAGLSPKSVAAMYDLLQKVREEMALTIILIEQNISRAVDFCDSCILIQQGTIGKTYERGELKEIEATMFNVIGQ